MSIVEGAQPGMFAFPAGQAASRGAAQRESGVEGAGGRTKEWTTIKRKERSAFPSFKLQAPAGRGPRADF